MYQYFHTCIASTPYFFKLIFTISMYSVVYSIFPFLKSWQQEKKEEKVHHGGSLNPSFPNAVMDMIGFFRTCMCGASICWH